MSKLVWLVLALALVGCDDPPAGRPTQSADELWNLAPEGARGGIVMSPYGIGMVEAGIVAFRAFADKAGAELDPVEEQIDALLAPIGGRDAKLASLGLTRDQGGALFFHKTGMVAVLPIADRDAFIAKAGGTKSPTPDGFDRIATVVCKPLGKRYACASSEALFATIGKGSAPLKAHLAKAGARGDVELVGTELPFNGPDGVKAIIVATAQLERGSIVVRGALVNPPADRLKWIETPVRPRTQIGRTSGLAIIDLRAMFATVPPVPLVDGITIVDLVKTISGPLTINVPAGSETFDMELPLADPAPMTKVLAKCPEVEVLAQQKAKLVDGACRVHVDQPEMDLDLWVDGNTLHIGHKGAAAAGASVQMSPAALEIATNQWGFSIWGRGTAFAPQRDPAKHDVQGVNPLQVTPLRLMSLVDEAGFAARKEVTKEGPAIRFLLAIRTSFANPDDVVAKLVAISALDILANTAADKAKTIAVAHARAPFAADLAAGTFGLLLPTKLIDATLESGIPAAMRYFGSDAAPPQNAEQPPPVAPAGQGERTKLIVDKYATDVYAAWIAKNPTKPCPSIAELAAFVSPDAVTDDEWGRPLVVVCDKAVQATGKPIGLVSSGFDGKPGTADDIKSF